MDLFLDVSADSDRQGLRLLIQLDRAVHLLDVLLLVGGFFLPNKVFAARAAAVLDESAAARAAAGAAAPCVADLAFVGHQQSDRWEEDAENVRNQGSDDEERDLHTTDL